MLFHFIDLKFLSLPSGFLFSTSISENIFNMKSLRLTSKGHWWKSLDLSNGCLQGLFKIPLKL